MQCTPAALITPLQSRVSGTATLKCRRLISVVHSYRHIPLKAAKMSQDLLID